MLAGQCFEKPEKLHATLVLRVCALHCLLSNYPLPAKLQKKTQRSDRTSRQAESSSTTSEVPGTVPYSIFFFSAFLSGTRSRVAEKSKRSSQFYSFTQRHPSFWIEQTQFIKNLRRDSFKTTTAIINHDGSRFPSIQGQAR